MQTRLLRKSLGFVSRQEKQPAYVFVGSEAMLDACRQLVSRKGLVASFIPKSEYAAELSRTDSSRLRIMVFDASVFQYEEMMGQLPDRTYIGTYHLQTKTLITPWEVIR